MGGEGFRVLGVLLAFCSGSFGLCLRIVFEVCRFGESVILFFGVLVYVSIMSFRGDYYWFLKVWEDRMFIFTFRLVGE